MFSFSTRCFFSFWRWKLILFFFCSPFKLYIFKGPVLLQLQSCLSQLCSPKCLEWHLQIHANSLVINLSPLLFSCPKQGVSQLLPSPDAPLTRRIKITNFPSLPLESSANVSKGGYSFLEDPEVRPP